MGVSSLPSFFAIVCLLSLRTLVLAILHAKVRNNSQLQTINLILFRTFAFRMEEKDKKPTAGRDNSQSTHKKWAGEKKPSMKRRSEENNYTERGLYMV